MTYRFCMKSLMACTLAVGAGAGVTLASGCDDDLVAAQPDDAATDGPAVQDSNVRPPDDANIDGNIPSSPKIFAPTVLTFNLQPQPSPKIGGDPGITVPFVQVTNAKLDPVRKPDFAIDSPAAGGIGLGCVSYKLSANPGDKVKGPHFPDYDMGVVTINGYTGGLMFGPTGPTTAPLPKPITCKRSEVIPGLFMYGCDTPPDGVATGFLKTTDVLDISASGGSDLTPWALKGTVADTDNFAVTTDLWSVTQAMVDGSADLSIDYNCGGGPCTKGSTIVTVIQSTDGTTKSGPDAGDAGPGNPFAFPQAKNEFGMIVCREFLGQYQNKYTVAKGLLAQIPTTWTDLRIVVATVKVSAAQTSVITEAGLLPNEGAAGAAGFARFGITHR
jgi:hypothetical protein